MYGQNSDAAVDDSWSLRLAGAAPYIWVGRIGAAAVLSFLAWHGELAFLPLALLLVPLWACAKTRQEAFAVVLAYYLVGARSLPVDAAAFWADASPAFGAGVALWLTSAAILAGSWALFWGRAGLAWRALAAVVLVSVPPVGIIGWTSPLTAAGVLFPGMGWVGLAQTFILIAALADRRRIALGVAVVILCSSVAVIVTAERPVEPNWKPVNTRFGSAGDSFHEYDRLEWMARAIKDRARQMAPGGLLLLPEAVVNNWQVGRSYLEPAFSYAQRRGVSVFVGGQEKRPTYWQNAIYSNAGTVPAAVNRLPVPFGLWRPYTPASVPMSLLNTGIVMHEGRSYAFLVCYEQLVAWPVLVSRYAGAQAFLAPANHWYEQDTSLPAIQRETARAWAQLFGAPILFAENS